MAEMAYIFVGDILGFGNIAKNLSGDVLDSRISAWTRLVQSTATDRGIQRLQLISDTVFAGAPSSREGLLSLISFARDLLSKGVEQSLPIRGAIAHGNYSWGNLIYGPAVIAAHELERAQNWIGVACESFLPHVDDSTWSLSQVVCYPAPMKNAPIKTCPVVAWEIPNTDSLTKCLCKDGLLKEGEQISWNIGEKANNTILFRLYLHFLRKNCISCKNFYGVLPVQTIEAQYG